MEKLAVPPAPCSWEVLKPDSGQHTLCSALQVTACCSHQQHSGGGGGVAVNKQQSCRHNPVFITPAAFGKSCSPLPAGRDCGAAIPQLGSQGPSLASRSLQSPLHDCALPVRLSHPQHCSPSPPASTLPMSSVQAETGPLLSWFPKETRAVQPWAPAWSSPPCPGISAGMFHLWAPEASRSRHRMRGPLALIH